MRPIAAAAAASATETEVTVESAGGRRTGSDGTGETREALRRGGDVLVCSTTMAAVFAYTLTSTQIQRVSGTESGLEGLEICPRALIVGRSDAKPSVSAPAPEVGALRTACRRTIFRCRHLHCSSGRKSRASQQSLRLLEKVKVFSKGLQQGLPVRAESDTPLWLLQVGRSAFL